MTILRVVDFETTGFPPNAGVIEIGITDVVGSANSDVKHYAVDETQQWLCNPNMPMNVEALAVHHIRESELAGMPHPSTLLNQLHRTLHALQNECDVFVAHNVKVEKAFFSGNGKPWICTFKASKHIWPSAPRHTNQVLKYWLNLELNEHRCQPPHRAGPDTYVTAHILTKILNGGHASIEQLIEWTDQPVLLTMCGFGKHKDKPWSQIPTSYMDWLLTQQPEEDVRHTCEYHIKRRRGAP